MPDTQFQNIVDKYLQVKNAALEILDELSEAVVIVDEDGVIQFLNRKAVHLFKWPKSMIMGKKLEDTLIPSIHKDAHTNHRKEFNRSPHSRPMRGVEGMTRTGEKLNIDVSINAVETDAGKLSFAVIREKEHGESN